MLLSSKFIINKNQQNNGDYEVHNATNPCGYMPDLKNRIDLGSHISCHDAVNKAKIMFPQESHNINGCYYCCNSCHTT